MTSPVDVVRRFYAALGRGDVPAVLSLLDPQVEWTEAERFPYYGGTWHGPQAVMDNLLRPLAADWDNFSVKPHEFIADGERVVSLGSYSGSGMTLSVGSKYRSEQREQQESSRAVSQPFGVLAENAGRDRTDAMRPRRAVVQALRSGVGDVGAPTGQQGENNQKSAHGRAVPRITKDFDTNFYLAP